MKFFATGSGQTTRDVDLVLRHPIPAPGELWMPAPGPVTWPAADRPCGAFFAAAVVLCLGRRLPPELFQPIDLAAHDDRVRVLNLHRGPTQSFKDVGCTAAAHLCPRGRVVVATSGDTGGAAAHAFGPRACVLYPADRVSPYQEAQMLASDAAVRRIAGDFDACQRVAKAAIRAGVAGSCNSISLARLVPQIGYFAWAAFQYPDATVVVPSGNMGNATACVLARRMGSPIRDVVVACNRNGAALYEHRVGGVPYAPEPAVPTRSSAMDVGTPSNLGACARWAGGVHVRVGTEEGGGGPRGEKMCPHTAVAFGVAQKWDAPRIIVVRTADAVKFAASGARAARLPPSLDPEEALRWILGAEAGASAWP